MPPPEVEPPQGPQQVVPLPTLCFSEGISH
jgi:hypothetical protein